ncbi:hypothetical protein DF153_03775 [Burkholderia cenocepacia]|nr:hypothetical protein DF152_08305 [Burkholderia cenocepacia]RQU28230.1 hypothetical protein DF153_03775 [Burkholderia cenocepacia]
MRACYALNTKILTGPARAATAHDYNETRPHMALKDLTPGEFAGQYSLRPKAHERPNTNARHCPRNPSGSNSPT